MPSRALPASVAPSVDDLEQQVLRPFEARRDLQRRERFALRVVAASREKVALTEIAVRRRAIGGSDRERGPELANRGSGITTLHRETAKTPVALRIERIDLDDPIVGDGERLLVARLRRQRREPPRRFERRLILREQRLIGLDGPRRVAKLFGKAAHDGMGRVLADGHRHERRRAFERLEGSLVLLRGERRAEDAAAPDSCPGLAGPRFAFRESPRAHPACPSTWSRSAARTDEKRVSSILSNEACSASIDTPSALRDRLLVLGSIAVAADQRSQRRVAVGATMWSTSSDAW